MLPCFRCHRQHTSEKRSQSSVKYAGREKRTRKILIFISLFLRFSKFLSAEEHERKRNTKYFLMNAALVLPVSWQWIAAEFFIKK